MKTIGLDIGTTSISAAVVDEGGSILDVCSAPNASWIQGEPYEKIQDPEKILKTAFELVSNLCEKYPGIDGIGVTGQMHGIVYINDEGAAVSPLYTWQDGRGDLMCDEKSTYARKISEVTGYPAASGFGAVTHFYNVKNNLVPKDAAKLCTIHDYAAMRLCGRKTPVTDTTDAASLCLFDIENGVFDTEAFEKLGLSTEILPEVCTAPFVIGKTADGIPVTAATGDNQASFLGSVRKSEGTVLLNVGTGSQVSVWTKNYTTVPGMDTRPFPGGGYLLVGAPLCGGRSYALLKDFFDLVPGAKEHDLYTYMNKSAEEAIKGGNVPSVDTAFCGTRENPEKRGGIFGLGIDNFTPGNLCAGVLCGMTEELYELYAGVCRKVGESRRLVGSGNGVRRNPLLCRIMSERFGLRLEIPAHGEEASYGAALVAFAAVGAFDTLIGAQEIIKYEGE